MYGKIEAAVSLYCIICPLLNRRPDDWTLSAGGSGTIYGWGHNHRGQLGGIDGAKVKVPTPCEALATLRPVQLIGGEQTLFAVTADGKVSVYHVKLGWVGLYFSVAAGGHILSVSSSQGTGF